MAAWSEGSSLLKQRKKEKATYKHWVTCVAHQRYFAARMYPSVERISIEEGPNERIGN
jgi:hypothetical protein